MELSNTSLQLERVATFLTRLNKATEKYNQDILELSAPEYKCRFSEDMQAGNRARINNEYQALLTSGMDTLRKEVSQLASSFEADTQSIPCQREALNSCLIYLNTTGKAFDETALGLLMAPIISNGDYNSYMVLFKTCAAFYGGNTAELPNFPHQEVMRVLWYWERFKAMCDHVKEYIDNMPHPESIPSDSAAIEIGDLSELIRYIRMIQKECIPVLENPQEHISADSDSWMPNEAFFKG